MKITQFVVEELEIIFKNEKERRRWFLFLSKYNYPFSVKYSRPEGKGFKSVEYRYISCGQEISIQDLEKEFLAAIV